MLTRVVSALAIMGTALSLASMSANTIADVKLTLEKPSNKYEKVIYERLETSPTIETAISFLNNTFDTKHDITLKFGSYDKIWYQQNIIEIPYFFIHNIRERYSRTRFPNKSSTTDQFTGNTLLHVIFHEFAHAIIEQYDLPIVGKEEDAADNFADVLLLDFFDVGADIVTSAADLFLMNSMATEYFTKADFWKDHSLDKQRYFARLCNIYGSNPDKHEAVKKRAGFSDGRAGRCVVQYHETRRSWLRLLQPSLKASTN